MTSTEPVGIRAKYLSVICKSYQSAVQNRVQQFDRSWEQRKRSNILDIKLSVLAWLFFKYKILMTFHSRRGMPYCKPKLITY